MDLQKECLEMVISAQKCSKKLYEGRHVVFNFHVILNYIKFFAYMNKEDFDMSLSEAKALPKQSYSILRHNEMDIFHNAMIAAYNAYFLPHSPDIHVIIDNPIISDSYVEDVLDEFITYHMCKLLSSTDSMIKNKEAKYTFKQNQRLNIYRHYFALMILEYIERVYENPTYRPNFVIDIYKLLNRSEFEIYNFDCIIKKSQRYFESHNMERNEKLCYIKENIVLSKDYMNMDLSSCFKDFAKLFKKYDITF